MSAEFGAERLRDLVITNGIQTGPFGSQLHAREYAEEGVPVVMPQDLSLQRIDTTSIARIPRSVADRLDRHALHAGDIVYARRGDLRRRALVTDDQAGWVCGTGCLRIRFGPRVVPRFAFYALGAPEVTEWIDRHAVGATMPNLNTTILGDCEIRTPPIAEQRAIASVLGALDDKIDSNRRLAEAARNVLSLVVSGVEGIPAALDDTALFLNGGALTKLANGLGRPILRIKELRAGVSAETPRTDRQVREIHNVQDGDLLFSWSGTLMTRRWTGQDAVLNQHVFRVDPQEGLPVWLIEMWIDSHLDAFRKIAADKATTMGHIQRHHLSEAVVHKPSPERLAELRAHGDPLDGLRVGLLREAGTLTALRDALLPKLVSGKIRVPLSDDPAEALGAAVEEHETQQVLAS